MGYFDDSLAHHGILGQKWGVRRFENAQGHLTAAGKKRYDGDKVSDKEKHAFSAKAAGWNALSKTQAMNAKVYDKLGNKTMASIQKTVSTQAKKNAEKAQKEADAKKAEKEAAKGDKKGLTDKQKKMIIAGAAVAGTALAAYGGYKLYQLNKEAKEGLSNDYHKKAVNEFVKSRKLEAKYYGDRSAKTFNAAADARERAEALRDKAKSGKYSVSEKVDYIKKTNAANKLASEASTLAKSVTAEGPKSFSKPTQNSAAAKQALTNQKLSATVTSFNAGKKAVSNATKIHGQTKFSQASKANDDYVQQLLKKNSRSLSQYSMNDLKKLDLY